MCVFLFSICMFLRRTWMPFCYIILYVWIESYFESHFTEINNKTKYSRQMKMLYNSSLWEIEEESRVQLKLQNIFSMISVTWNTIPGRRSHDFNLHNKFVVFVNTYCSMSLPVSSSIKLILMRTNFLVLFIVSSEQKIHFVKKK